MATRSEKTDSRMLDSLSGQTIRGGQTGRSAPFRGVTIAVIVAGCLFSPLLLTACSQQTETPSPQVRAGDVAATVTAEPAHPAGSLTPATPPPTATSPSLPAAVPTPEPPPSPTEAPSLSVEPAAPATEPVEAPGPTPTVTAGENAAFVSRVVDLINAARRQEGLEPLSPAASLTDAAQRQARAMAQADRLSHTAPDGSTVEGRVQAAGYGGWTALGEVVAAGATSPKEVVADWLASPEHRARLLDPVYRELGAGYYCLSSTTYGHWWAVDLGTR